MKGIKRNIINGMGAALVAVPMAFVLPSCGALINEELDPCPEAKVNLRFVYEYNMERANAFHNQVHCLALYVFDEDGNLVSSQTEQDETNLKDESFNIQLELEPGKYHAVAYGGMECRDASFFHPTPITETRSLTDLQVALHPDCLDAPSRRRLHNHFHGSLDFEVVANENSYEKVEMMRNTNTIQVALQNLYGSPISHEDFDFTITDDNTLFDADNNLIPNGVVEYKPFATETRTAGVIGDDNGNEDDTLTRADGDDEETPQEVSLAMAHFTTSRIVRNKQTTPTLTVTRKKDAKTVFSIPLANYMLLFKENHDDTAPMTDQEYLDRENSWRFVFFLDDRNQTWVNTRIIINDWIVRINNTEF